GFSICPEETATHRQKESIVLIRLAQLARSFQIPTRNRKMKKVIVIGLDGFEPKIVEPMLNKGELPNLARLRDKGGFSRIQTTYPAQTPVAWSTFATGMNPGGHGIFDFIRRDPKTYLPDLSMNRHEQKHAYLPPKAVSLVHGTRLWELLSAAGLPSSVV